MNIFVKKVPLNMKTLDDLYFMDATGNKKPDSKN